MQLEDTVPWNAVKSSWRARRPGWRRALKGADSIAAVAAMLDDFRSHFANDSATIPVRLQHNLCEENNEGKTCLL